ncbi:GlcG/HbpS family heme-binding protein [Nocardia huaxiensis]|uniref:GlcG/HbpS family heme-binding protein n=1 Tax=Nocardia huaxiensis TaxID=2755382 RepID=UPI001E543892|nr:heme-binding protein [Nocardia huaxiensis]UFS93068.1 heme-binding protein [Nocardia huaxiensis]
MTETKKPARTRLVIAGAAAAVIAAGGIGIATVNANGPDPAAQAPVTADISDADLQQSTHLTIAAATRAAQSALDAATKANQHVTVAVVDRNGNTIVVLRGDGAGPQSYDAAQRKAFTAASWNAPTSQLTERLKSAPQLADIPGTLFLGGGAPIQAKGGAPIAGIGVAGAPSGDQDETFARAGIAALGS